MKTRGFALSLSGLFAVACQAEPLALDQGVPSSEVGGGSSQGTGDGIAGNSGGVVGTDGSGGTSQGATTAPADYVTFANGQGVGVMTGYGWVNLGSADTVTTPVCSADPTTPSITRPITGGQTSPGLCPETDATVWSNPDRGLCLSGAIPLANSDWENDWGIRVSADVDVAGGTLGKRYTTVAFSYNSSGVTPANPAIRGVIHVKDDPAGADTWYCAVIQPGEAVSLTAFNPDCWWPNFPGNLTEDQIPNIDEIGIQIPSDNSSGYTISDLCWTGITLSN